MQHSIEHMPSATEVEKCWVGSPNFVSHRDQINASYPQKSSMNTDQPEIITLFNSISLILFKENGNYGKHVSVEDLLV